MNILVLVTSLKKENGQLASPVLDIAAGFGSVKVIETSRKEESISTYAPAERRGQKQKSSGVRWKGLSKRGAGFYMNPTQAADGQKDHSFSLRCLHEIRASDAVIALLTYGAAEIGYLMNEAAHAGKKVLALSERFTFMTEDRIGFFRGIPSIEVAEFSSDTPHLQMLLEQFLSSIGASRVG